MTPSNSTASQRNSYSSYSESQEKSEVPSHSNVSTKRKSQIGGKNSVSDDESVELTSTIKTPRLQTKSPESQNNRELFSKATSSERSVDRSSSDFASKASNESDESEISQESRASETLPSSEPRMVARTNNFILIASALTALSAPFVMILGPKDLASRATWFGLAAVSGLVVGAGYCCCDFLVDRSNQFQSQQRGEISPA